MRLPKTLGTITFWLAWPALWVYLKDSSRTRVIIHCQGKVLLIKPWLGLDEWGLPGGGRHKDETAEHAGVREVLEETGIDIKSCEKQTLFTDKPIQDFGFSFSCSCIAVTLPEIPRLKLQSSEIIDSIWADRERLKTLRLAEVTRDCLEAWSNSLDLLH